MDAEKMNRSLVSVFRHGNTGLPALDSITVLRSGLVEVSGGRLQLSLVGIYHLLGVIDAK